MPTTFVGLLIFVAFLTPGFLYTAQRRALAPQAERSVLMETTAVVAVSLATNAVVVGFFGVLRWLSPEHTPDVGQLLTTGSDYPVEHLPYVLGWATVLFLASCALAVWVARWKWVRGWLGQALGPITDSSAWCETFAAPDDSTYPHAGVELADGGFVSGRVYWFSTDLDETGDRDLVLGTPLQFVTAEGEEDDVDAQRVIVSARDIRRIYVTYIEADGVIADNGDAG